MKDNLDILLGSSIPLPEVEDDLENDLENTAETRYEFEEVLDKIGKDDFKEVYLVFKNSIIQRDFDNQVVFCKKILERLHKIYNIEFAEIIYFNSKEDITNLYIFLEFIEYNSIHFFSDVWRFLNVDLRKIDIDDYCIKNEDIIMKEISDQLETHNLPGLISEFLRTYNKSDLINLFVKISKKNKMLILMRILGGLEL